MGRPRACTKLLALLFSWTSRHTLVSSASCNSQVVTDPIARGESTGWVSQDLGAGKRRQGHVSGEVEVGDEEVLVVYGGTSIRNDDVNHVTAKTTNISLLSKNTGSDQIWTQLETIGGSNRTNTSQPRGCCALHSAMQAYAAARCVRSCSLLSPVQCDMPCYAVLHSVVFCFAVNRKG